MKPEKYVNLNDRIIAFDSAVSVMDDDIRERLHAELAPCSEQAFIDAYATAHFEAYGEAFTV